MEHLFQANKEEWGDTVNAQLATTMIELNGRANHASANARFVSTILSVKCASKTIPRSQLTDEELSLHALVPDKHTRIRTSPRAKPVCPLV